MTRQHSKYREMFPSRNVLTPNIIGYDRTPRGTVYELSEGRGIVAAMLYGVTIHEEHNPTNAQSRSFDALEKAKAFIKEL